jgi:hypothetical protein
MQQKKSIFIDSFSAKISREINSQQTKDTAIINNLIRLAHIYTRIEDQSIECVHSAHS